MPRTCGAEAVEGSGDRAQDRAEKQHMMKAVMFVAISFSGVSESTYTIPGYDSLEACKQSQPTVSRQLMTEPFVSSTGEPYPKKSLPDRIKTKCVEL